MSKVRIVGAGMAGLLAGVMLRKQCSAIYEASESLPNNHSAVLRFRSSVVADTVGIPFKKVTAIKAVEPWRNPIADAMAYSIKTNGTATMRSVLTADSRPMERYIAPPDFVSQMAKAVEARVALGRRFDFKAEAGSGPIISTVPMPTLMEALGYEPRTKIEFRHISGANLTARLVGVDAYCSLYVADPEYPAARISITGDRLSAECYGAEDQDAIHGLLQSVKGKLGLDSFRAEDVKVASMRYAKILPIDEGERRRFIMWASDNYGVHSLGRFATWRPGLLLDDVVNDVRVISRLINNREESYSHKLKG